MKIVKIGIGLIVVIAIVFAGITLIEKRRAADEKLNSATIYPIEVNVITLKDEHKILSLPYLAEVKNDNSVMINSKFAGRLNFVKNLGEKVRKKEIVAKIDDSTLKAKLSEIKAQITSIKSSIMALKVALNNLKANHKRTKSLLNAKMASIEQYNNESTKIAQTIAQVKSSEAKLISLNATKKSILDDMKYTNIKSPINGIISAKFFNVGDNVFPGKAILKISSQKGNYLSFALPNKPQKIIFDNKIYNIVSLDSTQDGMNLFKVNINKNLPQGEKVNIKVITFDSKATFIPFNAILTIDNQNYVLIPQGNKAISKKVHIIASGEKGVVIKENIKRVIQANPDILLKIKAGYPIKEL